MLKTHCADYFQRIPIKTKNILFRVNQNQLAGFKLRQLQSGKNNRFFISHVTKSSPADRHGITVGDELISINGNKLKRSTMIETQMV